MSDMESKTVHELWFLGEYELEVVSVDEAQVEINDLKKILKTLNHILKDAGIDAKDRRIRELEGFIEASLGGAYVRDWWLDKGKALLRSK